MQKESYNFLKFVQTAISEKATKEGNSVSNITMDELVPPQGNTRIVGAQALQHILFLATGALLVVKQDQRYGDIDMRLTAKATRELLAMEIIEPAAPEVM